MRNAKVDSNHKEIVDALRKAGYSVVSLARIGGGCPDLLIGRAGKNYLLEVKDRLGKLNDTQKVWHTAWRGQVEVVHSAEEAFQVLTVTEDDWR